MPTALSPQSVSGLCAAGAIDLIDVRTAPEYRQTHAQGARLVPLDTLNPKSIAASRTSSADKPIYLICKSGQRAAKAALQFEAAGIAVACVEGGTQAWEQAGLPVVRGPKAVSLERQVRIAAGTLVVTGVALGHWVHPLAYALSAFVGAGLVFAGITDTCGMGMLLARMPWNRASPADLAGQTPSTPAPAAACCSGGSCCSTK